MRYLPFLLGVLAAILTWAILCRVERRRKRRVR
jgi:predicted PurR-regulated permease PerM